MDTPDIELIARWPLARAQRGSLVFGVLAGLARRIGMKPSTMRILFLLGGFAVQNTALLAAYFALALVMPVVDSSQEGYGMQHKKRLPAWVFPSLLLLAIGATSLFAVGMNAWPLSFGPRGQLLLGGFIIIVGAILLFGRQNKSAQPTEIVDESLTTAAYGAGKVQSRKTPVLYRSPANIAIRTSIAIALMMLPFDSIQNFFIYPLAIGLVVAASLAISTRKTRKVAIPLATVFTVLAGLATSTGMQIDSAFAQLDGTHANPMSPYYADRYYEYQYVGSKRKDFTSGPTFQTAFVGGEMTVHVQAPDDNKVILDGRMTAGTIVVRTVDAHGTVTSELSSQSGFWTEKKQTYGNGPKELHVKVHGGIGRIVLEIDRSEWVAPVCHPVQPEGSFYCD
jgi:phage shock protein PspC (stress-responsive transcriptional regulator)